MKFASIAFAAMVAYTQAVEDGSSHRELASLAQKWNITDPSFVYGSLDFSLTYGLTTYIMDGTAYDMIKWYIYDENCKPASGTGGHMVWAWDDATEKSAGFETVTGTALNLPTNYGGQAEQDVVTMNAGTNVPTNGYKIQVSIDTNEITTNSYIYSEDNDNGQLTAEVRFCNRFELWTPKVFESTATAGANGAANPTPFEVNFLETIVTLTVDLTDGFEIGSIAVEPKDRIVRTANQAYQVVGFLCGTTNTPLSAADRDRARNQGEVVRVCVEPDQEAQGDGIFMRSIDSFTFTRDAFSQVAITGGNAAPNLLTTYEPTACKGKKTCWFETILFANFYTSVGRVAGSGVASMQFGSAGRRLRAEGRNAQDDVAAAAEFELDFDVARAVETPSGAASVAFMTVASLGFSIVAALM